MKHRFLPLLLSVVLLIACNSETANHTDDTASTEDNNATVTQPIPEAEPALLDLSTVKITLDNNNDEMNPSSQVTLWIGEQEFDLGAVPNGNTIEKDGFENYNIPTEALAACGGWWAGGGRYVYIVHEEGKIVAYEKFDEEISPEIAETEGIDPADYNWKVFEYQPIATEE